MELIALYVNRSAEEWEEMLTTAGDTGRPKIEAKFEIVSNYMKSTWNIDLNELRKSYCAVRKKRPTSTSTRWMTKIRTRPKIPVQTNKRHRI